MFIFLPCLKQDALFYDIGSFCFAYRIRFFFSKWNHGINFFGKNYLAPQINTGHHLFTLPSSPKRHPVQDAKWWCNWILCIKTQGPKLHIYTLISITLYPIRSDNGVPPPPIPIWPHPNLGYDLPDTVWVGSLWMESKAQKCVNSTYNIESTILTRNFFSLPYFIHSNSDNSFWHKLSGYKRCFCSKVKPQCN